MRQVVVGFVAMLIVSLGACGAQAALVISVGSTSVVQGGTGSINVYMSSDAIQSMPDQINDYAFTLQITSVSSGNLAFSGTQSFAYLNSPQYVFYNDSADYIASTTSPPPIGGVAFSSVGGYPNDSFLGFDNSNSFNPISISSITGPVLLARLSLDASITSAGETFTVGLVPSSGDGSTVGGESSYFNVIDSNFNEQSFTSFTSTAGTVNIIASTVPEPASIVSGLTAVLMLSNIYWARQLRSAPR